MIVRGHDLVSFLRSVTLGRISRNGMWSFVFEWRVVDDDS